jgi:hypothetical protein
MPELLKSIARKVEDRTGVTLLKETKQLEKMRGDIFDTLDRQLAAQHLDDLNSHSDACLSEIEFVQGIKDFNGREVPDPHPDHRIVFDSHASDASRLL